MAKYKFEKCYDIYQWDEFVKNSPQGSIFNSSNFIKSTGFNSSCFFVNKGDDIRASFVVFEDDDHKLIRNIPFYAYNGIMFRNSAGILSHKVITEEFVITELVIIFILEHYGEISMSHSPYLKDLRPFLWYNFHTPEKGTINVILRYTAILKLGLQNDDQYLMSIRSVRRQEFNKKLTVKIFESSDTEQLNRLHRMTFERQNIKRTSQQESAIFAITKSALNNGYGRLSFCEVEGQIVSGALFLFDSKRAHYLFGATDPQFRNTGCATKLIIDNIMYIKKNRELAEIDFLGVNSPNRGDYKISFNTSLYPYFETHSEKS